MQVQLRLRQRGLRLFEAGFGLGDFLRTVPRAILAQLILRGLQRRLGLIARGAGVFQIVRGDGAAFA